MSIIRFLLILTVLLLAYCAAAFVFVFPWKWLLLGFVAVVFLARKAPYFTAFGTARWAGVEDIPHMLEGEGLILGQIDGKPSRLSGVRGLFNRRLPSRYACQRFLLSCQRGQPKQVVRLTNAVHTAVFAPTGVGKGVSCVVPFLLTSTESAVVVDFKGELFNLTAKTRKRMGHRIVVLDPFQTVTSEGDTFNPLTFIDKESSTAIDDCRDLGEAIVVRTGVEPERHWNDNATIWISAMMTLIVSTTEPKDRSLGLLKDLLSSPEYMQRAISAMRASDAWDGILRRIGDELTHFMGKELGSVITTVNRHLSFLNTPAINASTRQSTFDPADMLKKKTTVYLVMPPDRMRAQTGLMRLWVGAMLKACVKGGPQESTRVHFVLDEAASLGHMEAIDDAVDKYRGYGVRLQLYYQSLAQLKQAFPNGQEGTLLSNTTQVFFGVNDQETAEYVSNRLGERTIVINNGGSGTGTSWQPSPEGRSYSYSSNSNDSWQQQGRKLLRPEEVAALPERVALTFTQGVPPIATRLVRYYEKEFQKPRSMGIVRAAVDTASLFVTSLLFAVIVTAFIYNLWPE